MIDQRPAATLHARRHPFLRLLCAFPVAGFPAALAADVAYATSANIMWADFADWLLAGALVMGVLAAIVGLVVLIADRRLPSTRPRAAIVVASAVVLALGFVDNLVHSRDAWTSVVPLGLVLSGATTIVMLVTLWLADGPARAAAPAPARLRA